MTTVEDVEYIRLSGSPRERGRAQGEALRPLIALGIERWKTALGDAAGLHPDSYLERFVANTDFLPAIERWTPALLEEVRGLAEGANQPFRDIFTYQLMDEEWLFRVAQMQSGEDAHHCSVIGVAAEGKPTILAQNMDLPKYYDGTQTLLHIEQEHGLVALVFTAAGLIGTCGLNSAGVGLCVNTLTQLRHSSSGLPVAFVARGVLERPSVEEAASFVQSVSHASGQNYAIGGLDGIVDFECSAGTCVAFMPGSRRIYHTNHPLVNDDLPSHAEDAMDVVFRGSSEPEAPRTKSNSERRFDFLAERVDRRTNGVTMQEVQALLSSCETPISVSRESKGSSMTLGSLVMELSVPPVLHLAPGPPAETPYRSWTF
jgi:predicted choloylglycine hydrolase